MTVTECDMTVCLQVQHNQSSVTCTTEVLVQMSQRADGSVLEIGQLSNIVVCELLNELQTDLCFLYQLAEVSLYQHLSSTSWQRSLYITSHIPPISGTNGPLLLLPTDRGQLTVFRE